MQERPSFLDVALVVAGICLLLWRPGFFMDDEIIQAASVTAILDGHLAVHGDLPAGYDPILNDSRLGGWVTPHRGDPPVAPIASIMLSVVAAPLVVVGRAIVSLVGVQWTFALLAASVTCLAALRVAPLLGLRHGRVWAAIVAGGCLATPLLFPRSLPASPWLELGMLQVISIASHALAVALIHSLLKNRSTPRTAIVATTLYAVGTPLLFWALSAKYHSFSVLLAVLVFWLTQDGREATPRRIFLAFLVGGLACWNELALGLFLVFGLTVAVAVPRLRAPRALATAAIVAAVAFSIGASAFVWQQHQLQAEGVRPQFPVLLETPVQPPSSNVSEFAAPLAAPGNALAEEGYFSYSLLADPVSWVSTVGQAFVWTGVQADQVLSMLSAAPFMVLGLLGLSFSRWRRTLPWHWALFAVAYAGALLFWMGGILLEVGGGYDARYMTTLWPFLWLFAATPLAQMIDGLQLHEGFRLAAWVAGAAIAVTAVAQLLIHSVVLGFWTPYNYKSEHLLLFRFGGVLVASGLAAAVLWRSSSPRLKAQWVSVAFGLAFGLQVILQLTTARAHEAHLTLPAVFAPTEAMSRLVWKALFTFGEFTLP